MKTASVYAYGERPQFSVIPPAEKYHKTHAYPVGPLAQNIWEVLSVVSSHVTRGFSERSEKQEIDLAENGSIFGREKGKTPNFEMQLTKLEKQISLDAKMAFTEAFRSLIPTKFMFQDVHGYESLLSETRGGVHATGVVASEDLVEVIR